MSIVNNLGRLNRPDGPNRLNGLMIIKHLGTIDYNTAFDLQLELVKQRLENKIDDTLLLLEHPPVLVMGRSAKKTNILASDSLLNKKGIRIIESNRGGDVTFHCPGQLVGYPIIDLKKIGCTDIHVYLRNIEQALMNLLLDHGITAQRRDGLTGAWVGNEKIASIGLGVKKWVAFHGFALNVNNDLEGFSLINPCGIKGLKVTSISKILNKHIPVKDVCDKLEKHFIDIVYRKAAAA